MIGLLTYLPTTAYVPQFFFLVAFFYVIVRERKSFLYSVQEFRVNPKHPVNWNFLIIVLIIFFSIINRLIHWDSLSDVKQVFPYFILMIPTYVIAIGFNKMDAKVLIGLVTLEAIVVVLQWVVGVSTFDNSLDGYTVFEDHALAYFQRPFGWSSGSSIMATKLFLAYILLDFFKFRNKLSWGVRLLLLLAIVFTFNRTVILSLGIYLVLSQSISFLKLNYKLENAWLGLLSAIVGFISVVFVLVLKGKDIVGQLTRNTGTIELTGREYLWQDFYVFISEHLILGNGSMKLWLDGYHAHNSYIELIATNGVIISILYFLFIYINIKASNWVFVIPILIFGITQYAFFWGISLFDILFFAFLVKQVPSQNKAVMLPVSPVP
jgi:hypothetical protein